MGRETPHPGDERVNERLERLEELLSFAERRHDELNAVVLDLASRLAHVTTRLERLAGALEATRDGGAQETTGPDADGADPGAAPGQG